MGAQIRARRKALRVSATAAAGLSRVTLHRIEKGEPTVTMGAWANVCAALGMSLAASGADSLTPLEAHAIYERNARHLDAAALTTKEQALMQALRVAFGAADV